VCRLQPIPDRWKWRAEIAQQIGEHLPHGLRLARELGQVMPIVDRPLPESFARVAHVGAIAADNRHRAGPDADHQVEARPLTCRISSDQSLLENGADRTG
jgi:hypothetical protein